MSSYSRITCSKGLSDCTSLPPYTRPRKDTNVKADNTEGMPTSAQQQTAGAGDQLNSMVGHSPFARPGSQAGASTLPATLTEMPSASICKHLKTGFANNYADILTLVFSSSCSHGLSGFLVPRRVLLFWGIFVRGFARRDLC